MGDLVNVVRPDGTILQATEEDAAQLRQYGYKDQDPVARAAENVAQAEEAYYTTPSQKVKTAIEGLGSGMTLGISDKLLEATTDAGITGDEWRSRSEYNPGIRLGSELVGAIAPSFLSGGTLTPAGALVEGANVATKGISGAIGRSVVRGGIEGAGFGLGAEVSQSALTGDPLTVEGTLAGMGWGALWGGGLSAVGGAIEGRIAKKASVLAEKEAGSAAATKLLDEQYGAFRGAVKEAGTKADEAFKAVEKELDAQVANVKLEKHRAKVAGVEQSNAEKMAKYEASQARRAEMTDYASKVDEAKAASKAEADRISEQRATLEKFQAGVTQQATGALDEAANLRNTTFNMPWTEHNAIRPYKKQAIASYNELKAAVAKKDWAKTEEVFTKFKTQIDDLNKQGELWKGELYHANPELSFKPTAVKGEFKAPKELPKVDTPSPRGEMPARPGAPEPSAPKLQPTPTLPAPQLEQIKKAFSDIKDLGSVSSTLRSIAESPSGFAGMTPARFEKTAGALESFLKHPAAELSGSQEAIKSTIARLAEHAGVTVEGNAVSQLRAVWESARNVKSASGIAATEKVASGDLPWTRRAAQTAVGVGIGKAAGGGFAGYALGRTIAAGLLGVKGAVMSTIASSAEKWMPRAGKAVRYLAPKGEPLMTRLDGTMDAKDKRKSAQDLAMERMKEINEAAPSIRDTLYKQLQPINMYYPEYAAAMHEQAVNAFTYLYNNTPRLEGNAFNRLQPLGKPDAVAVAKFGRIYEIFHNPVKTMTDFLAGKRVSPEAAEAFSNMWPAVWGTMRTALIQRFSDPEVLNKMAYDDQVQMSVLTGIRMHSTLRPEFIASQQQMYQERNQPLSMPPQPGAPGNSGGASGGGDSPYATQAQKSTNR